MFCQANFSFRRVSLATALFFGFYACSKTGGGLKSNITSPAVANGYLTNGAWILKGSNIRDSAYRSRFLMDSLVITFSGSDSANVFVDTVASWFSRIKSFDTHSIFTTASETDVPDTLFSGISPYSFAFQLDTFLVKNLTDTQFVLEQYSKGITTTEIDTLRKSGM